MTNAQRAELKVLMEGLEACNQIAESIRLKINALMLNGRTGVKL